LEEIILRNRASRSSEPGAWNDGKMHGFEPCHTELESRKVQVMDRTSHRQFWTDLVTREFFTTRRSGYAWGRTGFAFLL